MKVNGVQGNLMAMLFNFMMMGQSSKVIGIEDLNMVRVNKFNQMVLLILVIMLLEQRKDMVLAKMLMASYM